MDALDAGLQAFPRIPRMEHGLGATLPCSNGAPCLPALADGRLEAMLVRVRVRAK